MADDGLLLNFSVPTEPATTKQKFKGGNWRDRLKAGRAARRNDFRPKFGQVQSDEEERILPEARPRKRPRVDGPGTLGHSKKQGPRASRNETDRSQGAPPKSSGGEVVSSLFTYNPTSTAPYEDPVAEDGDTFEASNAPLSDELATFTNLGLSSTLASHLTKKLEIKAPTAIQEKTIKLLCSADTDAFIQAETGSGKTLAYLLPILQRITSISKQMKDAGREFNRDSGLFAVVMTPTRELSKQISTVLEQLLSCCHWIVGSTVVGGEKKKSEKARLRRGVNILVATPGRLVDHLDNTDVLDVSRVRWLVLDEGDRLMELGFEKDIQKIISVLNLRAKKSPEDALKGLPNRRTTVLCSATIKADVNQLRTIALREPVSIAVDPAEQSPEEGQIANMGTFSAPSQLKQSYAVVPAKQRLVALIALLRQTFRRKGSVMKCIVFMSCADSVDFHFELLTQVNGERTTQSNKDDDGLLEEQASTTPASSKSDKIPQGNTISEARTQGTGAAFSNKANQVQLFRLHGSLQQATRTSALRAFMKSKDASVLICTDVASRGLDLPNVDLVIEYDPPFNRDDHLHRVGRTARAGKDGRAMIFLMPGCEEGYVNILKDGRPHHLTRHDADELLKKGFAESAGAASGNQWEDRATDLQLEVERWVLEHPKHLEQARRAFQSHVRAYATHVAAERGIFDMQQLHLGHLAKAFALRDKPGNIKVPGLRPNRDAVEKTKNARKAQAANRFRSNDDVDYGKAPTETDELVSRKRMQAKMKALSGASEFNLG